MFVLIHGKELAEKIVTMSKINTLILSEENFDTSLNSSEQEIIALHKSGESIDQKINDEWVINIALEKRSLEFIQYLLENKFKIRGGQSALLPAIKAYRGVKDLIGLFELVEKHGYKIDKNISSLLFLEVAGGEYTLVDEEHFACLDYLLDKGADINFTHKSYYSTPLIFAVFEANYPCVKYLLEKGANPNGKCSEGSFPILYAVGKTIPGGWNFSSTEASDKCLEILLKHGADPRLKQGKVQDALYWAKRVGNTTAIERLKPFIGESAQVKPADIVKEIRRTTDPALLEQFHNHKSLAVRRAVANHNCTENEILRKLVTDKDELTSLLTIENIFSRQEEPESLESLIAEEEIQNWYLEAEKVFEEDEHKFLEKPMGIKGTLISKYSDNLLLHRALLDYYKQDEPNNWFTCVIDKYISNLIENPWLAPEIQREFVFELKYAVEKIMMKTKDKSIFKEYLALENQPDGVRGRVLKRYNELFG